MLTLFHVVWCGVLGMLWTRRESAPRLTAVVALLLYAVPRLVTTAAMLPGAWMQDAWGYAMLAAFAALTVLWFVWLVGQALGRGALVKLALPMLVLAAVECLGPLSELSGMVMALVAGSAPAGLGKVGAQLLFCLLQVLFLRTLTGENDARPAQWSRP